MQSSHKYSLMKQSFHIALGLFPRPHPFWFLFQAFQVSLHLPNPPSAKRLFLCHSGSVFIERVKIFESEVGQVQTKEAFQSSEVTFKVIQNVLLWQTPQHQNVFFSYLEKTAVSLVDVTFYADPQRQAYFCRHQRHSIVTTTNRQSISKFYEDFCQNSSL